MAPQGEGAKSGGALPKLRNLCPKIAFLGPKRPQNPLKAAKYGETLLTLHVHLDCPMTKSSFLPSNSTICLTNGPKMAKNGPNRAQFASHTSKTKNGLYLGLRGSTPNSEGTCHPQPPTFCGFQPSESANKTAGPPYQWSRSGARGQRRPRTVGANGGSTRVSRGKKNSFFQSCSRTTRDAQTRAFSPFSALW